VKVVTLLKVDNLCLPLTIGDVLEGAEVGKSSVDVKGGGRGLYEAKKVL